MLRVLLLLGLVATAHCAAMQVLPGAAPKEYKDGENVDVQVNVLTSVNTHLPFDFYTLPMCLPTKRTRGEPINLGQILMGDRIKPAPYEDVMMGTAVACAVLCEKQVPAAAVDKIIKRIKEEYLVNLILDNLPLALHNPDSGIFSVGYPLGVMDTGNFFLYNHIHFHVKYHEVQSYDGQSVTYTKRIVQFTGKPMSLRHKDSCTKSGSGNFTSRNYPPLRLTPGKDMNIVWSWGVSWERSDEPWATRWDPYLNIADHEIHWFSIMNSSLVGGFLSGLIIVILTRTLRKDIKRYNRIEIDPDDIVEETGWKLCHRDVFRPPQKAWLLAAFTGTGVQLLGMSLTVILFACLGFLSPANRGSLFTALLVCFVFLGMYAGYSAARLLKVWDMASWKYIFLTGTIVPAVCFACFFFINLFVWFEGSSAAVPFPTMIAVIAMWFCISLPLVFVGAVLGYKRETLGLPTKTNQIPRHIPELPWHMNPYFTVTMGGILPFGAVFIEVFFILTSLWLNRYYYVFGFLLLVFIILTVTCAEITIVMVYFQLCAEDYHWWWRSFLTSGSCAGYLFLYTVFYFFTSSLRMTSFVPILLYFGYMAALSFVFFIATGTIGFFAAFWFVRKIYGSIKIE